MNAGLAIDVSELSAANAIQASFVDLHKTRELLNTQLSSELVKQDSERIFSFQRKFCMFERVPPQADFSINSWLNQAEKYDEEKDQKLRSKYPWYADVLQKAEGKVIDNDYEVDSEVQDQFFRGVKQLMRYSIKSNAADFFNLVLKLPVRRGVSQASIASTLIDMCKHFNVSEMRWRTVMMDNQRPDLAVGLQFFSGPGTARKIVTPRAIGLSVMTFR
ncbi:hypothetical protein CYMTET_10928 [Cymbomonas tetramitiformis]|nr:hypothetical protein CYMTET_10928 [Cymbomonas tetramitiformis]